MAVNDQNVKYSLKWFDFSSSFSSGFQALLEEEALTDVTLAADGGEFLQAHKLVLSVCSPYFKHLFKVNPCKHPIVVLKDVSIEALKYMLEFMYKGEVGVRPDELPAFLSLAQLFKIKGLSGEQMKEGLGYTTSNHSKTLSQVRKKKMTAGNALEDDCPTAKKLSKRRVKEEKETESAEESSMDDGEEDSLMQDIEDPLTEEKSGLDSKDVIGCHMDPSEPLPQGIRRRNSKSYRRSVVWHYFILNEETFTSRCKVCGRELKGIFRTNAENHLRCKHFSVYEEYIHFKNSFKDLPTLLKDL